MIFKLFILGLIKWFEGENERERERKGGNCINKFFFPSMKQKNS